MGNLLIVCVLRIKIMLDNVLYEANVVISLLHNIKDENIVIELQITRVARFKGYLKRELGRFQLSISL